MGASKKLAAANAVKKQSNTPSGSSQYSQVLQGIHATADDVANIMLAHIPEGEQAKAKQRLLDFLRDINAAGASDIDRMVVIGALSGLGHVDFGTNEI